MIFDGGMYGGISEEIFRGFFKESSEEFLEAQNISVVKLLGEFIDNYQEKNFH